MRGWIRSSLRFLLLSLCFDLYLLKCCFTRFFLQRQCETVYFHPHSFSSWYLKAPGNHLRINICQNSFFQAYRQRFYYGLAWGSISFLNPLTYIGPSRTLSSHPAAGQRASSQPGRRKINQNTGCCSFPPLPLKWQKWPPKGLRRPLEGCELWPFPSFEMSEGSLWKDRKLQAV